VEGTIIYPTIKKIWALGCSGKEKRELLSSRWKTKGLMLTKPVGLELWGYSKINGQKIWPPEDKPQRLLMETG